LLKRQWVNIKVKKDKIKIAFLNDTMGPYHYARLKAANILSKCTFIEFSSVDHTNYWDTSSEHIQNKEILFTDEPITKKSKQEISKRLNNVLDTLKADVVLISGWDATASLIALKWCIKNNTPSIILSESQKHDFKRSFIKEIVKRLLLKLFDSAFVGGKNQIRYLSELGFNKQKIYPGCDLVDNDYFMKNSSIGHELRSHYRDKYKLPKKFFFTSCRFIEKKNLKFLISSFAKFQKDQSSWNLVIAGDGPMKKELMSLTEELNIANKVFFPGYIQYDEIPIFYGLSSCFILPSITEQWGLVINESLASGKPVIVSNRCGSAPNLVEGKDVGYTFDPYDESDLISKMNLISSEGKLEYFSKNTKNVISSFDNEHYSLNLNNAASIAVATYNSKKNLLSKLILRFLIFTTK
tara:strand:- start:17063 stop:18292 length:1230 start_codon:yes stop_codon:yes gene_type:complete